MVQARRGRASLVPISAFAVREHHLIIAAASYRIHRFGRAAISALAAGHGIRRRRAGRVVAIEANEANSA
jgi:hypothetical protein